MTLIRQCVTMAKPSTVISQCAHEPDNRFLECAEEAEADYLVTGNTRHFPKHWTATKVANAGELLQLAGLS